MTVKINQVFFIFNTRELSLNRKDLQASTLVGLTQENPALDPLAVLHLDNWLYMYTLSLSGHFSQWVGPFCVQHSFRCHCQIAKSSWSQHSSEIRIILFIRIRRKQLQTCLQASAGIKIQTLSRSWFSPVERSKWLESFVSCFEAGKVYWILLSKNKPHWSDPHPMGIHAAK